LYNRTKSKAQALIERGAKWCDTVGECAKGQDVVITIVGYPKDVEQVYLGAGGIIDSAKAGAYLVDMTTSSPILAEKIFAAAQAKGLHAVDAPVTGGDVGARNATLTILVGGAEDDFNALQPVFAAMGKNIVYEGSAGAGQKTKACNQIAIAGTLAGVCEAFAYAKASGLDVEKVYSAIATGAAGSFQMTGVARKGLDGDFNPGFMTKHFGKDLAIGTETATAYGATLPILAMVLHEIRKLEAAGAGELGTQALLKYYGVK
ncbi:MAG: NAD(P)-dependent oxidoreductase, partial [Selenomonadaceae bacterium]|nr:NAD(P)-dependent oxidoreductase [Selenomonadaceae bacterium]